MTNCPNNIYYKCSSTMGSYCPSKHWLERLYTPRGTILCTHHTVSFFHILEVYSYNTHYTAPLPEVERVSFAWKFLGRQSSSSSQGTRVDDCVEDAACMKLT